MLISEGGCLLYSLHMTERRGPLLPRPPETKNMTEFVVLIFVLTIATMLIIATIGTGLVILFRPESNAGPLVAMLSDIMSTILGALIGFIAGRGSGRTESVDEVVEAKTQAAAAKAETRAIQKAVGDEVEP